MRIEGEQLIEAPRPLVWEALLDPDVLAGTLPGFQRLERVGENEYAGALALGVGPVQGRFEGNVTLHDLQPPESYRLKMSGRGGPGYVEGGGLIELREEADGTRLAYRLDVEIGGKIAALGQRMLDMTARMMTKHALDNLARELRRRAEAASS